MSCVDSPRKQSIFCILDLGGNHQPLSTWQSIFVRNYFTLIWAIFFMATMFSTLPILAQTPTSAIGHVEILEGSATAVRANNTVNTLKFGDPIFTGDTIKTGPSSTLGITFLDGTLFSLSANGEMVINSLIYNPKSASNSMLVDLVKGVFVFLSGNIATTGNMIIDTPVATLGIRGTQPWVTIGPTTSFAIMSESDGSTGEYLLFLKGTNNVIATVSQATVGATKKIIMSSPSDTPQIVDKTTEELLLEAQLKRKLFALLKARDARLRNEPGKGPDGLPKNNDGTGVKPGDSEQGSLLNTTPADTAAFKLKLGIILDSFPSGGSAMVGLIAQALAFDIGLLGDIIGLLENANGGQKAAIGAGLGRAAKYYENISEKEVGAEAREAAVEKAELISKTVAKINNPTVLASFRSVLGNAPAAIGTIRQIAGAALLGDNAEISASGNSGSIRGDSNITIEIARFLDNGGGASFTGVAGSTSVSPSN